MYKKFYFLLLLLLSSVIINAYTQVPDSKLAQNVRHRVWPSLQDQLRENGFGGYSPLFIRILKDENQLEVWIDKDGKYDFFKTYPICFFSGGLGTKTKTGDGKSPEGFYTITPKQLNPISNYHLAINIGYPNQMEQAKHYSGSSIMIHGNCVSIGCYAMTDPQIEEIYTLVYMALTTGQKSIPLHIFPFKMDERHMRMYSRYPDIAFWKSIRLGYDFFEKNRIPPTINVVNGEYQVIP